MAKMEERGCILNSALPQFCDSAIRVRDVILSAAKDPYCEETNSVAGRCLHREHALIGL
jgi:hypothetical protein